MNNSYTAPPRYYEEPKDNTLKMLATAGILQGIAMSLQKFSQWCGTKLMQGKEFTSKDNVTKIADGMIERNNLKDVKYSFINEQNIKNIPENLRGMFEPIARGQNAFYSDALKIAVAPDKKPSLMLHELGHAINAHKGKFLKFLQKSRGYVAAVPTALVVANGLFERKDNKKNFVERNAGIIGFSAFLPTIIEEGLASIRGVRAARKTLGKAANLAPLKRNYFFAWLTYLIAGAGLGIAAKQTMLDNR